MKTAESYPKGVEHTVGKGEIAGYKQFLLFPQCFQKACFPGNVKLNGNNVSIINYSQLSQILMTNIIFVVN